MSLLEVLQLIGYSTGAALHLWMGVLLLKRRRRLGKVERVLLALALGIGFWHGCNLLIALHALLGLEQERWSVLLRIIDTLSVVSITLSYSFLLHVHLHLWANSRGRALTFSERVRVYLSYAPALFLFIAAPRLWVGSYEPMFIKLSDLVLPFAIWAAYVLTLIAITDLLIARLASSQRERWQMRALASSFISIGLLILAVYGFHAGEGTSLGEFLKTIANLGSLLPTALIVYYIYRYRYLELVIRESLIVASFAVVVLAVYLYGIRSLGTWLTLRYGLRSGAVEAILILALALVAAPLRRWLEKRFHRLFEREATLYRDVVSRIGAQSGQYRRLPELLRFVEQRTAESLGLRRVKILLSESDVTKTLEKHTEAAESALTENERVMSVWGERILELTGENDWQMVEDETLLDEHGYALAYPLRREDRTIGLMLIDATPAVLTSDVRAVLEVLANQVAIAIEDARLVEENVSLERRLAHGERLAALGQMAATVAHEVKNPLSAIKSIAQVMQEDAKLKSDYGRDLNLIVGETDRLSRSVTQLLSFAKRSQPVAAPSRVDDLIQTIIELLRTEAREQDIAISSLVKTDVELDGTKTAALRDALMNLLINALQATPRGGRVSIEAREENEEALLVAIEDNGPGIPKELRERIWEPFFTTRQRGTGLGLAIVQKRIEEVGGTVKLAAQQNGGGAKFEIRLSLKNA